MPHVFREEDWQILRRYIYALLVLANGERTLLPQKPPRTLNDMEFFVRGVAFDIRLTEALRLTADALKDASSALTETHRVAAAIQVDAPTDAVAEQLAKDLHALGSLVQADTTVRALSGFFATAAGTINSLRQRPPA